MYLRVRVLVAAGMVFALMGGFVTAQVLKQTVPVQPPVVLSGSDVGFQLTGHAGTTPVGNLVVRVDGKWVPVQFEGGVMRLSTR
jgi:hypothetical protein